MATVTVTTRVASESASGIVLVFSQADGSAAQAIVPVSVAGQPATFVNQPNPGYTTTAVQVAISGMNQDATLPASGPGQFYGLNLLAYYNETGAAALTPAQVGAVRSTGFRALHVNLRDSLGTEVIDTSTHAVQATLLTMPQVIGPDTHGSAVSTASNRPVMGGFEAVSSIAAQPLMGTGSASFDYGTLDGRRVMIPFAHPGDRLATTPLVLPNTTSVVQLFAGIASRKIALLGLMISNSSSVTDTEVIVKDNTSEIGRFPAPHAGGLAPVPFPFPLVGSMATAMNIGLSVATSAVTVTPFAFTTQV
jgi:hypothetical protein